MTSAYYIQDDSLPSMRCLSWTHPPMIVFCYDLFILMLTIDGALKSLTYTAESKLSCDTTRMDIRGRFVQFSNVEGGGDTVDFDSRNRRQPSCRLPCGCQFHYGILFAW